MTFTIPPNASPGSPVTYEWLQDYTESQAQAAAAAALELPLAGGSMTGPIVTQVPNIVFDGDSLTIGTGALPFNNFPLSNDYPSQVVASLDRRGTYYNVGVAGETTATMITNAPTVVDAKLLAGANNVACFHGGTNDIYYGADDTTTYDRIVTYCQARQAAGWKVIVATITPRSDPGTPAGQDTCRLSVNSMIRANWQAFANGIADIGADVNMGTLGDETNTRYYNGDDVHHNPDGYRVLAGYFLAALSALGITGHQHGDLSQLRSDLWIPAQSFAAISGSPALAQIGNTPAWELHHGATDGIGCQALIPADWLTWVLQAWWSNTGQASGNAIIRGDYLPLSSGSNLLSGTVAGAEKTVSSPSAYITAVTALTGTVANQVTGSPSRTLFDLHILRLGSSGSDTLTGDVVGILGAYLYRTT